MLCQCTCITKVHNGKRHSIAPDLWVNAKKFLLTMSTPGVEPGLSQPRRDVLATRRCGPWMLGNVVLYRLKMELMRIGDISSILSITRWSVCPSG